MVTARPAKLSRRGAALACAGGGLVVAALIAAPRYLADPEHASEAAMLSLASGQGLVPAEARPSKGTEIFQWDPYVADVEPHLVGVVTNPDFRRRGASYALVKTTGRVKFLWLDIKPHEMRYWIRR